MISKSVPFIIVDRFLLQIKCSRPRLNSSRTRLPSVRFIYNAQQFRHLRKVVEMPGPCRLPPAVDHFSQACYLKYQREIFCQLPFVFSRKKEEKNFSIRAWIVSDTFNIFWLLRNRNDIIQVVFVCRYAEIHSVILHLYDPT